MLKKVFAKNRQSYQMVMDEKFPLREDKKHMAVNYKTQSTTFPEQKKSKFSRVAMSVCRYIGIGASNAVPSFCYPPSNDDFFDSGYYTKNRSFSRSYFDTAATLTIP